MLSVFDLICIFRKFILTMSTNNLAMQQIRVLMALFCLLGFPVFPTAVANLSTAAPPNLWNLSDLNLPSYYGMLVVLSNNEAPYKTYFGFYSSDGETFTLSVMFFRYERTVIWSANPDNPVRYGATLNFTREGDLLLSHGNGTMVWSTATKDKPVAGMSLDTLGNLVLFDNMNTTLWQSFDHPTDTLVMGQSLCIGMSLRAKPSNTKWESAQIYLSAELEGLRYSLQPTAFTKLFQPIIIGNGTSTCYTFVNGSLGFPNQIISLPPAKSLQFMRLQSDGHLRLYEILGVYSDSIPLDVFSTVMDLCDYPLTCGDYGICSNGQCSCPSLSYFRFDNERHPDAGCTPLSTISCNHMRNHQLLPLNNVSYFSDIMFQSLSIRSTSEVVCKSSCLRDCSCRVILFQYGGYSDTGSCLLLSEQKLIFLSEGSSYRTSAFIKIQGDHSKIKKIRTVVGSVIASFSVLVMLFSAMIWKKCKKVKEELFDGIPGAPKRFSFYELKVATSNFSVKLGGGGFGSVFKGIIGKENIAVKRLEGLDQGMEEFLAEVITIGRIHHLNLVRLIGFCAEKSHRLLVYEYMSNGSLDKWIFHSCSVFTLSWKTRRNIIMVIARGLSYLHEECKEKIAHLDIKPQNILLDNKFNAKLSDFGLSKMINRDQSKVMTRMRGTRGYLAPEWLGSKITEKADIYSFGIVIMEIICGRENLDESQPEESIHLISLLQEKARTGQLFDLVDSTSNDMQFHMEEVMEMMKLAMWCLQVDSTRRPLMSTVAKALEGATSTKDMPDYSFVPSFSSSHADVVGPCSSYKPSDSHLSGPR